MTPDFASIGKAKAALLEFEQTHAEIIQVREHIINELDRELLENNFDNVENIPKEPGIDRYQKMRESFED
jgi:hypothetical protein